MNTGFDTSKIANGNRPFTLNPPPLSVRASHWIGMLFIATSVFHSIIAVWVYATFGLTQFYVVTAAALAFLVLGVLICAFAQACKANFDTLQIIAYNGKSR